MKVLGDELIRFMNEAWPGEDWYWDHDVFEEPDPAATYETSDIGGLYYQGSGDDPSPRGEGYDLGSLIKKWRKARDYDLLNIEVPKAETAKVFEALTLLGAKVAA